MIKEITNSIPFNACIEGFEDLINASESDLCNLYYKYIDFCLSQNFPELITIKQVKGRIEAGIVVDEEIEIENPERLVVLGDSIVNVEFTKFAICRIYIKNNSKINICASGNSIILVDALENSNVHCEISDKAKIFVNKFIGAKVSGASKTIKKNRITYDLGQ